MTVRIKTIMRSVLLMSLAACVACADRDDLAVTEPANSGEAMKLNCEIEQQYQTRVDDGGFVGGDAIGVYIVDYDKDGKPSGLLSQGNHANNVKFTFNEDDYSWKGAATLYWTDKTTPVDAYSYYPFTEYISDVSAYPFTIERRQDKDTSTQNKALGGYEASDFLWAKAGGVQPGTMIQLDHRHLMASVQVRLVEGEDFNGTWDGLEKSVLMTNTATETTINLATGTASVLNGSAVESITPYSKGDEWRCIIAPQTVAAGKTLLAITVDGESYNFARETDMTFQPGRMHKFTIKVDKKMTGDYQFTLVDEAVTPWEADGVSHQAMAKVYTVIHVPEPGMLEATIKQMGLDPEKLEYVKLTGVMTDGDFDYINSSWKYLCALNMKELRTKQCSIMPWWGGEVPGWGIYEDGHNVTGNDRFDDAMPTCAFRDMRKLQHVVLPDSTKYLGWYLFERSGIIGRLTIPEGVTWIGDALTAHAYSCTSLSLPSTVKYIGSGAFGGLDSAGQLFTNELVLPDGLQYLGNAAFSFCRNMTGQVHLPSSLKYIGDGAFESVSNLTGVAVFPAGLKKITGMRGTNISGAYIPEGAEEIGGAAFWGCKNMGGDYILPASIKRIGEFAFAGTAISHITLPPQLEVLEGCTFADCKHLSDTVIVPEGVYRIGSDCFNGCSNLDALILPSTLEIIEFRALAGLYSLSYLQCDAKEPPTLTNEVFFDTPYNNFTLVVPDESIELYQQAEGWREFKRIASYKNFVCRPQIAKVLNNGGKRDVVLNCDAAQTWSVTHCPDWLHIDKTSGKGKSQFTITIDKMAHGSPDRVDEIVFKMGDTDVTTSFKVSQFDYQYDEDEGLALHTHTKGNGVDLVIVGDGYDAEDIARGKYLADMMQEAEYFFDIEPYKTYKDYFNVYTAFAMSYESGIGSVTKLRDSKFDTSYGNWSYDSRISTSSDAVVFYALDNTPVKESDVHKLTCILTANGAAYDGVTMMYGNGTAVAICPMSTAPYPNDARGLVQHEACGHAFGKLADEYIYHYYKYIQKCGCDCCGHDDDLLGMQSMGWGMNLSLSGKTKDLPWQHLLKDWRMSDIVDVWEGGFFHQGGVYRSEYNSVMNNNVPYLSTWSRELIVRRIMDYAGVQYDYEQFVANDSREWGKDFTLGTRASAAATPMWNVNHGHAPIMIKGAPKRNN